MIISIISALGENRVIGKNNGLPWHLPADFKYFKEKTLGKTIVMGLNTFKSIGEKPLLGRKNIVLNNDLNYQVPEGCFLARSIDEVLEITKNDEELMVCGGASVYKQFLPMAHRLYLTLIHQPFEGDTFFPEFNMMDWKEISREDHGPDPKNAYRYSFVVLEVK
ncbi:MAG: dihydrofolate reductase [Candidatus Staskawiczbacteria bacterium RIFCSPHIGHO2_02_FULL_42_22]|uniref:Dihydrofolate reductase n=1 Tax=Candidatus Staskawiczbacteria bacterium RIFCSPHIGHO2_02_FULL_42_22 TaxID=1802207 RepID=A0A1G2I310_9BACT|nr:MAG: dihydrofolate reductase [Candidatus Staskawiczbacteria bacterium RIFCSPHIGHO2_02_FULL_42_22]